MMSLVSPGWCRPLPNFKCKQGDTLRRWGQLAVVDVVATMPPVLSKHCLRHNRRGHVERTRPTSYALTPTSRQNLRHATF
jgi:hypothetical protein